MAKVNERFGESYTIQPSGCWLWNRETRGRGLRGNRKTPNIYGAFYFNGKTQSAHRVAWQLTFGPIPSRLLVCHTCDNGLCVNPEHLFLGTNRDNMQDCSRKGRIPSANKPFCKNGHSLDKSSALHKETLRGKIRQCRGCIREAMQRLRAKRRVANGQ